jgi:16S rRNA (cytosine1402-N4)-methyltransferase
MTTARVGHDGHVPVLPAEVVRLLDVRPGQGIADLTAGRGGHAELLARAASPGGRLVVMDLDRGNLDAACARVTAAVPEVTLSAVHGSFAGVELTMARQGWPADRVLADLGFSSTQMDDPSRGFSFMADGPLDMRLDPSRGETAAELLEHLPESALADAIFQLGEDPFARRIARVIAERRRGGGLRTTGALADAVRAAYGARARESRMHPATRTFMALRILVNGELEALRALLEAVGRGARAVAAGESGWLAPAARVAIISFHSLEDRLVKQAFHDWERAGLGSRVTRKPVEASDVERRANPRSRSAKLRVFAAERDGSDA